MYITFKRVGAGFSRSRDDNHHSQYYTDRWRHKGFCNIIMAENIPPHVPTISDELIHYHTINQDRTYLKNKKKSVHGEHNNKNINKMTNNITAQHIP